MDELSLPVQSIPKKKLAATWTHLDDVKVQAFCRAQPKILIGPDSSHLSVAREIVEGPPSAPMLTKTSLGWAVHGSAGSWSSRQRVYASCVGIRSRCQNSCTSW